MDSGYSSNNASTENVAAQAGAAAAPTVHPTCSGDKHCLLCGHWVQSVEPCGQNCMNFNLAHQPFKCFECCQFINDICNDIKKEDLERIGKYSDLGFQHVAGMFTELICAHVEEPLGIYQAAMCMTAEGMKVNYGRQSTVVVPDTEKQGDAQKDHAQPDGNDMSGVDLDDIAVEELNVDPPVQPASQPVHQPVHPTMYQDFDQPTAEPTSQRNFNATVEDDEEMTGQEAKGEPSVDPAQEADHGMSGEPMDGSETNGESSGEPMDEQPNWFDGQDELPDESITSSAVDRLTQSRYDEPTSGPIDNSDDLLLSSLLEGFKVSEILFPAPDQFSSSTPSPGSTTSSASNWSGSTFVASPEYSRPSSPQKGSFRRHFLYKVNKIRNIFGGESAPMNKRALGDDTDGKLHALRPLKFIGLGAHKRRIPSRQPRASKGQEAPLHPSFGNEFPPSPKVEVAPQYQAPQSSAYRKSRTSTFRDDDLDW